ncbi:hypothetical protein JOF57_001900 [Mycolicibacterium lutetiense]|uniref:Uncharacterized protein n=1 Tax=Mycolicibacterium lutetiense TaxID=1641992 RepID=A0ABS4ZR53_9MYCO|nr:hypothetical protein [Mycolicibacterium lutetiense]
MTVRSEDHRPHRIVNAWISGVGVPDRDEHR